MIDMDENRRADFLAAIKGAAEILDRRIGEPVLDKGETLRAMGQGVALLLALAAEILDARPVDDPAQMKLFPDA